MMANPCTLPSSLVPVFRGNVWKLIDQSEQKWTLIINERYGERETPVASESLPGQGPSRRIGQAEPGGDRR
jgi:hypothetical protein